MAWIVSMVIAVIVCGMVFAVGRITHASAKAGTPSSSRGLVIMLAAAVLFVLWAGLHTAAASIRQIEAGHVGVVYQFGSIVGQKDEGLQLIAPWQSMRVASVQVQRAHFENIECFSAETQDVFIAAAVNYSVSEKAVQTLYRTVGARWFDRLVEARVQNFFKEETVKYEAVDVAPNRERIRKAVLERLAAELAPYSVNVQDLLITSIEFSAAFKSAIEQKQIATQDALREQERVKQREAEAQQAKAVAIGKADALREEARGQADANKLLTESITPQLIQFQAVQKLSDNVQIALLPSGQGIIIDPATFLKPFTGE
ncbi:MAG: prohibitin family protein [Thermoflexaceae bacterium]|nr:prohibitin family protein [Thermoflexaceae bacterium]